MADNNYTREELDMLLKEDLVNMVIDLAKKNAEAIRRIEFSTLQVNELWRTYLEKSVRVALADSDHHRRSMLTGLCMP